MHKILLYITLILLTIKTLSAQNYNVEGTVKNLSDSLPVPFATVVLGDNLLWCVTNENGYFILKNIPRDNIKITVQCLGFVKREFVVRRNMKPLKIFLQEDDLTIEEVTVTAKRTQNEAASTYSLDRTALDHSQIISVSDVGSLLPGGKTVNASLTDDSRISLRSGASELGNASFGTAIEVDGARISNNAATDETSGASVRNVSSSNIESVEIITGIPSVEYGDLSNGIVKVNTKKGKTPFAIDLAANPHTKQVALSKGFDLKNHAGMLNLSFEHAKSYSDITSPYTCYQRNVADVKYSNTFLKASNPLMFSFSLSGNSGGYNSEDDPDAFSNEYTKKKDYVLRASSKITWLLNKPWITNFYAGISASVSDKTVENNYRKSESASQPYSHAKEEGYFIAEEYDKNPVAPIILSPVGYWYVKKFSEIKPMDFALKIKVDKVTEVGSIKNKITIGGDFSSAGNLGRGLYYDDMRYAPDYREYRYDELPFVNNAAFYAEDKFETAVFKNLKGSVFQVVFGLREDLTMISGSDYGTVSSLSPRSNAKLIFWDDRQKKFKSLSINFGYGKSVKLPSFQILYPEPQYAGDKVFSSTSDESGTAFYAYYNRPFSAERNKDLKWQSANQAEIGLEAEFKGIKFSISLFRNETKNPYIQNTIYTPFVYYRSSLENSAIEIENRIFSIDRISGVVTVSDKTGSLPNETLPQTALKTFRSTPTYVNGTPLKRSGIEWILEFPQIKALKTSMRFDGNFYAYNGTNEVLTPFNPSAVNTDGTKFNYIGYYVGTQNSYSNGSIKKAVNQNITFTTHVPKIRMIVSLKIETTLYRYSRTLMESGKYNNVAFASKESGSTLGTPYDKSMRDVFVTVYPVYYSTWENPEKLIPFETTYIASKDSDPTLFADLGKLTSTTSYSYNFNPEKISAYYSANLSITKEISKLASISFYANNFFCHNGNVKSTKTGLKTSLYDSGYIPQFYYGITLRIKI
jgi:hypothetical protein